MKIMSPDAAFTVTFLPVLTKKAMQSAISIPAKIRNVIVVPTAGIVTNVGTKVPIILPTVLKAPKVPTVTITADGNTLNIPETPIYSSNANGYTDATHYQMYAPLKNNSVLKATSNNPGVSFQVSPITDGRATVRATYQGKEKVYLIN